ncbi:hypothetical protein Ptr902_00385 [Pyrenophora tritici-repentis]|nr:hypothetical protein Ptr902_00385 [Pyrenophora tritici-repentis]
MSSHAANYGLAAPFHTIALFGANGQRAHFARIGVFQATWS